MFLHLLVVNSGFKTSLEIEFNSVQARGELIIPGGDYIWMFFFFFRLQPGYGPITEEEGL